MLIGLFIENIGWINDIKTAELLKNKRWRLLNDKTQEQGVKR